MRGSDCQHASSSMLLRQMPAVGCEIPLERHIWDKAFPSYPWLQNCFAHFCGDEWQKDQNLFLKVYWISWVINSVSVEYMWRQGVFPCIYKLNVIQKYLSPKVNLQCILPASAFIAYDHSQYSKYSIHNLLQKRKDTNMCHFQQHGIWFYYASSLHPSFPFLCVLMSALVCSDF